jgi:hypothetical protein
MMKTKERSILFSGPMVNSILKNQKTVTRRIVNPQPPESIDYFEYHFDKLLEMRGHFAPYLCNGERFKNYHYIVAKYAPGDRLWVRETWSIICYSNEEGYEIGIKYKADNKESGIIDLDNEEQWERYALQEEQFRKNHKIKSYYTRKMYCTTDKCPQNCGPDCPHYMEANPVLWRPSIFLPRAAARIFLDITNVKIEHLHELDDMEARLEGFDNREEFIKYWDKLNKKRGFGWDCNPRVYRIAFKKTDD